MNGSGGESLAGRLEALDRVLRERPVVHYMSPEDVAAGRLTGVWSTERSCYEFLAECCPAGSRTVETGSGISTVLFAAWGTDHLCITPGQEEADAVVAYCRAHDIPTDRLVFDITGSDAALPRLAAGEVDAVLIDGGHGFPTPMIDWYYSASRLCRGGVVVIDDLQLPAVSVLAGFLDADPRWVRTAGTPKWAAFERRSEGSLQEDWFMQDFYRGCPRPTWLAQAEARARRRAGAIRRRVRRVLGP